MVIKKKRKRKGGAGNVERVGVYRAGVLYVVVYIIVEGVLMWQCECLWPEVEEARKEIRESVW